MNRTEIPLIRLLARLLFFMGICPLVAQEVEKEAPRGRQACIVAVATPEGMANPAKIMTGKDITEVILSKRSVGESVKIPEDGIVRMVREVPNPKDPEKPLIEILAETHIPDTVNKALVILVPVKPKEGSAFLFASRVQDLAAFRGGETLYLNLSPRDILVKLGEENIALRKGDVRVTTAARPDKPVSKAISYSFYDLEKAKWVLLSASTIAVYPTRREICIFSWDSRFNRLDYHGISFPVVK